MRFHHIPVLLHEVVALFTPIPRGLIIDCTVGGGGHAAALLDALPHVELLGLDLDSSAITAARERLSRFGARARVVRGSYAQLPALVAEAGAPCNVSGILVDLGVSSPQLDDAAKGFSLRADGPLDMRFGGAEGGGVTAAQLVNGAPEGALLRLFSEYGEDPRAARIARALVRRRAVAPFAGTGDLAACVAAAVRVSQRTAGSTAHPATRTFQALRIAVNDELGALATLLRVAPPLLAPGGRMGAITFHSLEDRAVKRGFAAAAAGGGGRGSGSGGGSGGDRGSGGRGNGAYKVLSFAEGLLFQAPSASEVGANPRSRSAKLRGLVCSGG